MAESGDDGTENQMKCKRLLPCNPTGREGEWPAVLMNGTLEEECGEEIALFRRGAFRL